MQDDNQKQATERNNLIENEMTHELDIHELKIQIKALNEEITQLRIYKDKDDQIQKKYQNLQKDQKKVRTELQSRILELTDMYK